MVQQLVKWNMTANASFFTAPFSFTTPNNPANYAVWSGTSNFGRINGQGVSQSGIQFDGNNFAYGEAPNGLTGVVLKLEGHYASTTLETTWDAVFDRGYAGDFTAIADFSTGQFYEWGTSTIVGGSGLFEGATGTVDLIQEGMLQVSIDGTTQTPPGNNGTFGFAKGDFKYKINLPGNEGAFTSIPGGRDQFIFDSITQGGAVSIVDFERKFDKIVLKGSDFNPDGNYEGISKTKDADKAIHFVSSEKPRSFDFQATLLYNNTTGGLRFDPDGRGPEESSLLAVLRGDPSLGVSNFMLGSHV